MAYNLKYTIGADPELFIRTPDGFVSAHNLIDGTKHAPMHVENGAIQADGTAAEFNIHPATSPEEFCSNIKSVLEQLSGFLHIKNEQYELFVTPVCDYDPKYFKKLPSYAKALGCEPDWNAYTGNQNHPPKTNKPFRTGAGHIHVGWTVGEDPNDGSHMFDARMATKQLDHVLYPMSLLWDNDQRRRTLYGKIGAFRPKHYGVEYRPLSNAWVADPDLQYWIFDATVHAMDIMDSQDMLLSDDEFSRSIHTDCLESSSIERSRLLEYHDYLVTDFHFPRLPYGYIDSAKVGYIVNQ